MRAKLHLPRQVHVPDLPGLVGIQLVVVEREMDSRFEGFVESPDLVCCEEKDAGIVFQHAEEHGNDSIARQVSFVSSSQEDICVS